jgi:hypothetical protein
MIDDKETEGGSGAVANRATEGQWQVQFDGEELAINRRDGDGFASLCFLLNGSITGFLRKPGETETFQRSAPFTPEGLSFLAQVVTSVADQATPPLANSVNSEQKHPPTEGVSEAVERVRRLAHDLGPGRDGNFHFVIRSKPKCDQLSADLRTILAALHAPRGEG